MNYPVKHICITINQPMHKVYEFTSDPNNLPLWAAGLAKSKLQQSGENWIIESPMGTVKVKFAKKNDYGIIDHYVTLPSGEENYNPLRVFLNGEGSEIIFSVFHLPRMTEKDFKEDSERVYEDLKKLKEILEN